MPNVAMLLADQTHLTRRTVGHILLRAGNLGQAAHNPAEYIQRAADAINRAKRRFLVDGVQYLEVDDGFQMSLFRDLEVTKSSLLPIEKSIYDHVVYDSGVERNFAEALEAMDEVELFSPQATRLVHRDHADRRVQSTTGRSYLTYRTPLARCASGSTWSARPRGA